jgi:hypothetical protein
VLDPLTDEQGTTTTRAAMPFAATLGIEGQLSGPEEACGGRRPG